ncbi:hypothetical protein ACFLU8_04910 [Chloroflexota bacterium]
MTLLVAAKAGPGLKPSGQAFIFEPGIVITADTRLSYADGMYIDDGVKVGVTGSHGICGMASDSIDIPSQAFHHFDGFMQDHPNISASEAVAKLQLFLEEVHNVTTSRRGGTNLKTTVFFGHSDPSTHHMSLYRLDSNDGFLPKIRDGFDAAGSHAEWVQESFKRIKHEYPTLTLHPFDGFPDNCVPIREGVAALVMTLIHAALEVAGAAEVATQSKQGIGGAIQAAIITPEGPRVADPQWYDKLKAWQVYKGRLE